MSDYLAGWRAGVEAAAQAAGFSAWKHEGNDAYSRGLDAGAIHQVHECVRAIRALPKPEAPDGWEPISTAPRGRAGHVWVADARDHETGRRGVIADGYVDELSTGARGYARGYNGDWQITHWRPLPAPPKGDAT